MNINFAGLIIAILGFFVAIWSVFYTRRGLKIQLEHNKKSVEPLAYINPLDYENLIGVKLLNNGTGPLIINSIEFINEESGEKHSDLISFFGSENILWSDFSMNLEKRSIIPSSLITLLEFKWTQANSKDLNSSKQIREILKNIVVSLEYENIYGDKINMPKKKLTFFDRNFIDYKKQFKKIK